MVALNNRGAIKAVLNANIEKLSFSNELLGKGELEFTDDAMKPSSQDLVLIDNLISQLLVSVKRKKLLLLIDEIQHLATDPAFDALTYMLHTAIDKRGGKVKVVFISSSRSSMNLVFNKNDAAFYNFTTRIDFPNLDNNFIEFIAAKLLKDYQITTKPKQLTACFKQLEYSPYWFIKAIHRLILRQNETINKATQHILELMSEVEDYPGIYKRLKPIERLVYSATVEGKTLYSENTIKAFERATKKSVHRQTIQRAVNKLAKQQLVTKMGQGNYLIEKPGFTTYCMQRIRNN